MNTKRLKEIRKTGEASLEEIRYLARTILETVGSRPTGAFQTTAPLNAQKRPEGVK